MNLTRLSTLCVIAASSAAALASTTTSAPASDTSLTNLTVNYVKPAQPQAAAAAAAAVAIFDRPKIGIRVGGGEWNNFVVNGGVDVTFNVPFLPLPAIRVDGEYWTSTSDFGKSKRGNAWSILGVQTFVLGYAGIGPTYYFTDKDGERKSGFGAKILGGLNLPNSAFVEAGLIIGPPQVPVFFTIGMRF